MQIKLVLYVLALLTGVTAGQEGCAQARVHFGQVDAAALTQIGAILEASEAAPLAAPGGLALAELPEAVLILPAAVRPFEGLVPAAKPLTPESTPIIRHDSAAE